MAGRTNEILEPGKEQIMSIGRFFKKAVGQASLDRWLGGVNGGTTVLVSDGPSRNHRANGRSEWHLYTIIGPR